jgi:hypothetical protein
MGYTGQAVASLLLTIAILWIAYANSSELPGWLILAAGVAAALTMTSGLRALQKRRYYEGPRIPLIVDPRLRTDASAMGRRRGHRVSHK